MDVILYSKIQNVSKDVSDLDETINGVINPDVLEDIASFSEGTSGGITYSIDQTTKVVTANGTRTSNSFRNLVNSETAMPDGIVAGKEYYVDFESTSSYLGVYFIFHYESGDPTGNSMYSAGTITVPDNAIGIEIRLQVYSGWSANSSATITFPKMYDTSIISKNGVVQDLEDVTQKVDGIIYQDQLANLYEPQDIADIMDGYILKNGTPQTKYGSGYYVSDYVPVVGGKTITFSYAPWATGASQPDTEWRAAEYDSSKNYIRIISTTTHTLSSTAAYIRFSSAKGNETAAERLAYVNTNLTITDGETKVADQYINQENNMFIAETTARKTDTYFVDASNDEILIMWKMPGMNNKDVGIKMKTFSNYNNSFSFSSFGTAVNKTNYVGNKPSNYTEYMSTGEDHFSPFGVYAVNNIDGDYQGVSKYTGGFHKIDDMATARRISLDLYFDGRKINNFVGYCRTIDMIIVHNIQGANTFKTNGTGREIIKQTVHLHFENGRIEVETTVEALEEVEIKTWYFIQGHQKSTGLGSAGIRYIGGDTHRGIISMNSASNSGDKNTRVMRLLSSVLQMEMEIDSLDVGRFQYDDDAFSCDVRAYTGYSKAYFRPINSSQSPLHLDEGETCVAKGCYRFGMFESVS